MFHDNDPPVETASPEMAALCSQHPELTRVIARHPLVGEVFQRSARLCSSVSMRLLQFRAGQPLPSTGAPPLKLNDHQAMADCRSVDDLATALWATGAFPHWSTASAARPSVASARKPAPQRAVLLTPPRATASAARDLVRPIDPVGQARAYAAAKGVDFLVAVKQLGIRQ